jgi:hypothetical protein
MISVESQGRRGDVRSIVCGAEPEVSVVWAFGLFRPKLARVVLGAEDVSANSGLGPAAEDVVEERVTQGEFSRIAD